MTWRLGSGYCSTAHGHAQTCTHTLCVLGMTVNHAVTWRWEGEATDRKDKRKKKSDESEAMKKLEQGGRRAKGEHHAFLEPSADDIMAGQKRKE